MIDILEILLHHNLQDHKLAKSRNFGSPRRKKFKNIQYIFTKIIS